MSASSSRFPEKSEIENVAANWTLRIDRGLTAEEQDEYSQWLSEDPRHREAIAVCRWGWDEFDRLAGLQTTSHAEVDPDLLAPGNRFVRKSRLLRGLFAAIPLAASIAIMAVVFLPEQKKETPFTTQVAVELISRIEQRSLDDGSVISLNRGAVVETQFTPEIRRVSLIRGEAYFDVAKDPNRPFVVNVGGVDVRAVGTQFNIRLSDDAVDVIVSEGKVSVMASPSLANVPEAFGEALLEVGQRVVMALGAVKPRLDVTVLSPLEMDEALGWQPRLLDFDATPMREIVAEFNRRNTVQLVLEGASLEALPLSSSFWSDNVEGFVRLMESSFGMEAEWRDGSEIVLREANNAAR